MQRIWVDMKIQVVDPYDVSAAASGIFRYPVLLKRILCSSTIYRLTLYNSNIYNVKSLIIASLILTFLFFSIIIVVNLKIESIQFINLFSHFFSRTRNNFAHI